MPKPIHDLSWPSKSFYWAMLDTSGLPRAAFRRGPTERQLGYVFEGVLPGLQIEQVHAIYRQSPDRERVVACAVPTDALAILPDNVAALTPQSLPSFIPESIDASSLNVLTGRFLPSVLRRSRRRWIGQVAVILALCGALLTWGFQRRTALLQSELEVIEGARAAVLQQVLGRAGLYAPDGQPPELRLAAEVRRLEQTREGGNVITQLADCSSILETVLRYWPDDVPARAESVLITEPVVTIRANVATMNDAQRFASAFDAMPGWRLKQPRSESRRDHVLVTMRLEATKEEQEP